MTQKARLLLVQTREDLRQRVRVLRSIRRRGCVATEQCDVLLLGLLLEILQELRALVEETFVETPPCAARS